MSLNQLNFFITKYPVQYAIIQATIAVSIIVLIIDLNTQNTIIALNVTYIVTFFIAIWYSKKLKL